METLRLGRSTCLLSLNLSDRLIQLVLKFLIFDVERRLKGEINFIINGKTDFIKSLSLFAHIFN